MASDNTKSLEMEVVNTKNKLTHSEGILFIYTCVIFIFTRLINLLV